MTGGHGGESVPLKPRQDGCIANCVLTTQKADQAGRCLNLDGVGIVTVARIVNEPDRHLQLDATVAVTFGEQCLKLALMIELADCVHAARTSRNPNLELRRLFARLRCGASLLATEETHGQHVANVESQGKRCAELEDPPLPGMWALRV
jgi:hypothetical protein